MSKKNENIKLLLEAEKKAKERVNEAKAERIKRLKQANDEADEELKKYEKKMEEKFQSYKDQFLGQSTEKGKEVNDRKELALKQSKESVEKHQDELTNLLLELTTEVNLDRLRVDEST